MIRTFCVGLAATLLAATARADGPVAPDRAEWRRVVDSQLARYPEMRAEDVYKLAHQATFGPAHLIADEAAARRYLLAELGDVTEDEREPEQEELAADPPLVRVNLRPFKAQRSDPEKLLRALVETANGVRGEASAMRLRLEWAVEVLVARGRAAEANRLRALSADLEAKGFPAGHHSEAYTRSYHPAYRVVRRDLLR